MSFTRRGALALGGGAFASACASALDVARPVWPRVNVARERIVRVDVGLRPYRRSGFRVAREALGDKALVHNYGHGGGGITLSWGSSQLAVDLAYDSSVQEYAILGCGVMALSTARLLQERGARVRLYARELSAETTSTVAGGQWWPASVYGHADATDAFYDQLVAAMAGSFSRFQGMLGDYYGIGWEPNYMLSQSPIRNWPADEGGRLEQFVVNQRDLSPQEHPFAARYVRGFDTLMIDTPHYIATLEAELRAAGAAIERREFNGLDDVAALPERVVINCLGLGAGWLFSDKEMEPVRGQLLVLPPQPEITYNILGDGLYMFARRDGVVLGGTFEHGEYAREENPEASERILAGHMRVFGGMAGVAGV
jgi:glycine/D-amino acid oxidase-like deaminating enzyme